MGRNYLIAINRKLIQTAHNRCACYIQQDTFFVLFLLQTASRLLRFKINFEPEVRQHN